MLTQQLFEAAPGAQGQEVLRQLMAIARSGQDTDLKFGFEMMPLQSWQANYLLGIFKAIRDKHGVDRALEMLGNYDFVEHALARQEAKLSQMRTASSVPGERGVAETSDYFKRREREEGVISGQKPARKRAPAQTSDYARRRAQEKKSEQGVAEGSLEEVSLDLAKRARDSAEHIVDMDYDDLRDRPYGYTEKQRSKFQRYIDKKEPRAKGDRDWDPPQQGVSEGVLDVFKKTPMPENGDELKIGDRYVIIDNKRSYYGANWIKKDGSGGYEEFDKRYYNSLNKLKKAIWDEIQYQDTQGVAEGSLEEYGDTAKGQKMLTKVQKRAVDRMIKADDKRDAKTAKKNQDTANRAWERMTDLDEQGVAEGPDFDKWADDRAASQLHKLKPTPTLQVYKVVAVDKSNALSKQVKLKVKASSLDEVFERLAINDWYPLEINGVEVIAGKRLKQGVAEGSDDDIWGPQGNFAGDTRVNVGGASMKKLQAGDAVTYFGEKAKVVELNPANNRARISANGKTMNVRLSDLKRTGQGMSEAGDKKKDLSEALPPWDGKAVVVYDAKGNMLDRLDTAAAAQKYGLKPQDIQTQLRTQEFTSLQGPRGTFTVGRPIVPVEEAKVHISPSGVQTNMDPSDDDYAINYGKKGGVAKFRKANDLDIKTGKEEGVAEANDTDFVGFMNKALGDKIDKSQSDTKTGQDWYDTAPLRSMSGYKPAIDFCIQTLQKLTSTQKIKLATEGERGVVNWLTAKAKTVGLIPEQFVREDIVESQEFLPKVFRDPDITSWALVLTDGEPLPKAPPKGPFTIQTNQGFGSSSDPSGNWGYKEKDWVSVDTLDNLPDATAMFKGIVQKNPNINVRLKDGTGNFLQSHDAVSEADLAEDLRKWFKEKWVRFGPDGKIRGDCARGSESEGKPKCLPQSKAHALGKKGRSSAAAKKRREDPNPERRGPAKNVATKTREDVQEEKMECPPATQDIALNLENRQKAIDEYGYGPLNPAMPNVKFWAKKVDEWNLDSADEAKQSLCGNCAAFDMTSHMLDCIAQGIGSEPGSDPHDTIEAGHLGYCKFLKFKCASERTCDAWVTGGPITDKPEVTEEAETCPDCGGPMFSELLINEKQDACYYKVKSRYKVWPSAYASGALVQCRKKGAKNWGSKSEGVEENFADGKKPGRKGLAKRMGVPTKASVSTLRKIAKSSSGEKQRMAHWMANMKAGKQKNEEADVQENSPMAERLGQLHRVNQGLEEMLQAMRGGRKTTAEDSKTKQPEPPEADYGDEYQDMVRRVGALAKQGPRKTVWDPEKRVYKTVPVDPPK